MRAGYFALQFELHVCTLEPVINHFYFSSKPQVTAKLARLTNEYLNMLDYLL